MFCGTVGAKADRAFRTDDEWKKFSDKYWHVASFDDDGNIAVAAGRSQAVPLLRGLRAALENQASRGRQEVALAHREGSQERKTMNYFFAGGSALEVRKTGSRRSG